MITATCAVTLDAAPASAAFCKYALIDGSAVGYLNGVPDKTRSDFVPGRGYVTFAAGQTEASISVQIEDGIPSAYSKTFYIVLYDAYGCEVDGKPVKCVISYDGSTVEAANDDIDLYTPQDKVLPVETLPDAYMHLSFSSPENNRGTDRNNILNRYADWITRPYYAYHASKGLRYQRLCSAWDTMQNQPFGDMDPIGQRMQRRAVFFATQYGIKTFLSNHSNSQFGLDGCCGVLGDGILTPAFYRDMLQKQTRAFADIPGFVGLQINAEAAGPSLHGMTNDLWYAYARIGVDAVRSINDQIYILLDCAGGGATPYKFVENNTGFVGLPDFAYRTYIVCDPYADAYSGSGSAYTDEIYIVGDGFVSGHQTDETIIAYRIAQFLPWLRENGIRLMVGETAGGNQDRIGSLDAIKSGKIAEYTSRYCFENNIPMGVWCCGPDFNTRSYGPYNTVMLNYALTFDPIGSTLRYGPYEGGPVAATLAGFQKWMQPDITTTFKLNWQVAVSGSVAVIEVTANFSVPYPFSAAIDDGGLGGSFSPRAIAYTGNIPVQSYSSVYTPASGMFVAVLGVTNNAGFPVIRPKRQVFFDEDLFGTVGLSPEILVWPLKVVPGYAGPAMTIVSEDFSRALDVSYSAGGSAVYRVGATIDGNAVTAFEPGTPRIKTLYDQSGNGNHIGPYLGEVARWAPDGSTNYPPSAPTDYPRLVPGRDVPFLVPHFGADFGSHDFVPNRMDAKLDIDGKLSYSFITAVSNTADIDGGNYLFKYTNTLTTNIIGPHGAINFNAFENVSTNIQIKGNSLNFVEIYYFGGEQVWSHDGMSSAENYPTIVFTDGTSGQSYEISLDSSTVTMTPDGGSPVSSPAIIDAMPGGRTRIHWSETAGTVLVLDIQSSGAGTLVSLDVSGGYLRVYLNGVQVADMPAAGMLRDLDNGYLNIGWDRWSAPATTFELVGFIGIPSTVTAAQRAKIYTVMTASLSAGAAVATLPPGPVRGTATDLLHPDAAGNIILDDPVPSTDPQVPGALWETGGAIIRSKG